MSTETLLALFAAGFVIKATPGPGVFATVGRALFQGFQPTLVFIAGIMAGDVIFLALALMGLAAVAAQMGELFVVVRLLGGGYLIYMGALLWLRPPATPDAAPVVFEGRGRAFLSGVLLTFSNPKVMLLYLGLLPTFVDIAGLTAADMGLLAVMFLGILGSTLVAYAFASARARRLFRSARAMGWLNRGAGTVLAGTGAAVAAP